MSYTELESGYQDLRQQSQHDGSQGTHHQQHQQIHHGPVKSDGNERQPTRHNFLIGDDDNISGEFGANNDGMDSDASTSSEPGKQVVVGVCAMSKKTQSKPMKEIITRLQEFEFIKMVTFLEDVILKEPVDKWPKCDCLISFHSKGFPLEKAIQYAQLRKPYVLNNLHMQFDIQDRRRVYAILQNEGIEIPRYAVLDRDSPDPKKHELIESEDHVEVNGVIFNKPFVEKPVSAEDHNIYIYYPTSAGGGSQRLFRKIGSRSSVYSPESRVRKTGSFIYEDFMPTDGTDVKVYTVGPDYAHAEARKSPALDGKVERDSEGKEIRYPVILNNDEKLISRKVCLAFKQTVCGFDLLRANGKSYVCDVNGFSFVKNSNKYYDDCAKILGNMILRELTPTLHIPWSVPFQLDDPPIVPTTFGKMMELRCVVAVIRHGDRTPKQKMKVEVRHPKFFEVFEKYDGYKYGHIKLKRPKQLQEILDIARFLLAEIETKADVEIEEKKSKLEQLKNVLEMYGHFSGINRKVQMKYQPKGRPRGSSSDDDAPTEPSLVLILKWGGELTPAGRIQAEELGRIFRCMYPGGQGRHDYSGTQGLGLLRLHSTFRHDLKIYASDEGRVQMTAAAFAKGLLALEGELTPILVQMVKSANTNGLLDNDCDSSKYQNMAKTRLHELMRNDREFTEEDRRAINPNNSISINQALDFVKNPVECCQHVHKLIKELLLIISLKKDDPKTKDAILYHGETWDLMRCRWEKIEKDFSTKCKLYDISKIPDIYDCIKYDLQHNQHTLQFDHAEELYIASKYLADIVIPQEYGLTQQDKLTIGQGICTPLLKKIKSDLQRNIEEVDNESVNRLNPQYSHGVASPERHVRTRLYFTSESHVHSLLTVLRYGGLLDMLTDEQWRRALDYISMVSELNYMSQIVIMLYEDPTKDPTSEERFHVELHFSPGVNCCVQKNLPPGPGFRPHSRNDSGTLITMCSDDFGPSCIDEENDMEDSVIKNQKISQEFQKGIYKTNPIAIGSHYTVSGHEALDLAKRLNEELASQQQQQQQKHHDPQQHALQMQMQQQQPLQEQQRQQRQLLIANQIVDSLEPDCPDNTQNQCSRSYEQTRMHKSKDGNTKTVVTSTVTSSKRQRHSIAGQMSYMKMLGFGGFNKRVTTSTSSLFSTAVISGSSSAPNLRDMITVSSSVLEGFGGVPPIRPLETLHNALSLKQLDTFLEKMTSVALFKTPTCTPPKNPSTPLSMMGTTIEEEGSCVCTPTNNVCNCHGNLANQESHLDICERCGFQIEPLPTKRRAAYAHPTTTTTTPTCCPLRNNTNNNNNTNNKNIWSKQSSIASIMTEPSSPVMSDISCHETPSCEMSISLTSTEDYNMLPIGKDKILAKFFPQLDADLNLSSMNIYEPLNAGMLENQHKIDEWQVGGAVNVDITETKIDCLTPVSLNADFSMTGNKGSLTPSIEDDEDNDDVTPLSSIPPMTQSGSQLQYCYCYEQEHTHETQSPSDVAENSNISSRIDAPLSAPPIASIHKNPIIISGQKNDIDELQKSKDYRLIHGSINIPAQLKHDDQQLGKFKNLTQSTSNSNFPFESNTLKRAPNNVENFLNMGLTQSCINLINVESDLTTDSATYSSIESSPQRHKLSLFRPVTQSCSTMATTTAGKTDLMTASGPSSPRPTNLIIKVPRKSKVQHSFCSKTQSMDADFLCNEFVLVPVQSTSSSDAVEEVSDRAATGSTLMLPNNKVLSTITVMDPLLDKC